MITFLIILITAAFIATIHMLAPDHWLPITIMAKTRNFSAAKKYIMASIIALSHGALSSAIALAILYLGLIFLRLYVSYLTLGGLILLLIVGTYFVINGLLERSSNSSAGNASIEISVLPDFAIIPLLLSGSSFNYYQISTVVVVFISAGIISLLIVVLVASYITGFKLSKISPRYFDYIRGLIMFLRAASLYFIS